MGEGEEPIEGVSGVTRRATAEGAADELLVQIQADRDVRAEVFHAAVEQGMVLLELQRERSNLEEVFRRLTVGQGGQDPRLAL